MRGVIRVGTKLRLPPIAGSSWRWSAFGILRVVGPLLLLASAVCGPLADAAEASAHAAPTCDARLVDEASQHAAGAAINLANDDYAAASRLAITGLDIVGEDYRLGADTLDDTGQRLSAATSAETTGNLLAAANLRVAALRSRIEMYRYSHRCGVAPASAG